MLNSSYSRSYAYDDLDRLTWDSGVSSAAPTYAYDGNGNRLSREADIGSFADQDLTYAANSNRLATYQVNGGTAQAAEYDGMGNLEDYGSGLLAGYDDGGRLNSLWDTANATGLLTLYNGLGELARSRIWTPDPCSSEQLLLAMEYFTFAPDARALQLVSENQWRTQTDYVWLDDQPVAQFMDSYDTGGSYQGTTVTYLHADHLGTPRVGTSPTKQITWRWRSEAFGSEGPTGTAVVRLRHPGQVDLGVGGVSYNYFRDYDPNLGRYIESDPIGIGGGLNTYGYVNNHPLLSIDPHGLARVGYRPLAGLEPFYDFPKSPVGTHNYYAAHAQLWFDDISTDNIGFFSTQNSPEGLCGLPGEVRQDTGYTRADYDFVGPVYDDARMRQALENIRPDWKSKIYCLAGSQCQTFIDALLSEYNKIGRAVR